MTEQLFISELVVYFHCDSILKLSHEKYRMWNGFSSFHCLWVEFSIFMFQTHFWWDWNVDMLTHFGTQIKGSHSMCPPTIVTGCFRVLYAVLYNGVFFIPNMLYLYVTRNCKKWMYRKYNLMSKNVFYSKYLLKEFSMIPSKHSVLHYCTTPDYLPSSLSWYHQHVIKDIISGIR